MTKLFDVFPEALKAQTLTKTVQKPQKIEYAFDSIKKLPINSKDQVKSAIQAFFTIKVNNNQEVETAFKKIIAKANIFNICTIIFNKQYHENFLNKNSKC